MDNSLYTRLRGKKGAGVAVASLLAAALGMALWLDSGDKPMKAAAAATATGEAPASSPVAVTAAPVAQLGDLYIAPEEIKRWLAVLPAGTRQTLTDDVTERERWLRQHLQEKALLAEARQQRWDQQPAVAAEMAAAEQQVLARSYLASITLPPADYPSAQQLNDTYQAAQDKLVLPARYRLRQIFLAAPDNNAAVEKQAKALAEKARSASADFAQLANQYSQDARSVANGGDIGELPLQNILAEMRPIVSTLAPGEVSGPVRSPAGFHILKLEAVIPSRVMTLEEVAPRLTALLRQQRQTELMRAHLEQLLSTAPLTIDGPVLQQLLVENRGQDDR